jgi:hypothetical protein
MTTSAKNDMFLELKDLHLTKIIGRKPTAQDVDRWEDEAAEIATLIKNRTIPGGMEHGHLAIVIPEDEYRLEIEDEAYEYVEPTDPGSYPTLDGDEDEHAIKRLEAEHKEALADYGKYLGVTEHLRREFTTCMDATWIEALKRNRGGYANVTIKRFFEHLRTDVARLTTKDAEAMKAKVLIEWDQTRDITAFFRAMEEAQSQAERWNIEVDRTGMTNHAVIQMQESGLFDRKLLREWETREQHTKTWELMKQYFTDEFRSIQTYEPNKRNFESIHNITESLSQEVSEFFEEFRRDAIVGSEQIQQMAQTFKGATETMSTVLERLKAAMEENATLTKTVATLMATNKQLTENNKTLAEALKALGAKGTPEGGGGWQKKYHHSNPKGDKCNICNKPHAKPFKDVCFELEANKEKRPANWKSVL